MTKQTVPLLPTEGAAFIDRIRSRCTITASGCWEWNGAKTSFGYGKMNIKENGQRVTRNVHRLVARVAYGPIPAGMIVCHRCDVAKCCNPEHLYIGTYMDNSRDAIQRGRFVSVLGMRNTAKTHCPKGHEYSGRNLFYRKDRTGRSCRVCHSINGCRNRAKKLLAHRTLDLQQIAHWQKEVQP
jgi:hypothetical protein